MTEQETGKILMAISGMFSNFKANEFTGPTWQRLMKDIPFSSVISALDSYIASGKEFAPTPGQLLEILRERALPEGDRVTADEAWAMAVSAAQIGSLKGINHARTLAAIEQVSFERIRYADLETGLPFVRRDFIAAYERAHERDEAKREVLPLEDRVRALVDSAKVKEIA